MQDGSVGSLGFDDPLPFPFDDWSLPAPSVGTPVEPVALPPVALPPVALPPVALPPVALPPVAPPAERPSPPTDTMAPSAVPGDAWQPARLERHLTPPAAPVAPAPLLAVPAPPASLAETGLDPVFIQELTLKHVAAAGQLTGAELASRLRLPLTVAEEAVSLLRREELVELMSGGSSFLGIAGMRLRATERGLEEAHGIHARNGYVGPTPVCLRDLDIVLRQQSALKHHVSPAAVASAAAQLVLPEEVIARLGAGLESGGPILLYGQAGNGKTSLASTIAWMLAGGAFLPYAVEVDGYILTVFDRDVHEPLPLPAGIPTSEADSRWVYCQRPFVRAGAELRPRALDLYFNEQEHAYDCPLQLKATGGVLLLDDLGTQHAPITDLINRCLEPLASGTEYLTTISGRRVPVPFTPLLVLATAGDPTTLFSESHLRRLPCKIEVPDPGVAQFHELLRRACRDARVGFDQEGLDYLVDRCYTGGARPMRAAHPVELVRLVTAAAHYLGEPPRLSARLVDLAAEAYFPGALVGL